MTTLTRGATVFVAEEESVSITHRGRRSTTMQDVKNDVEVMLGVDLFNELRNAPSARESGHPCYSYELTLDLKDYDKIINVYWRRHFCPK